MKKLSKITAKYKTLSEAGRALKVHPTQLTRWLDNDAQVDSKGDVFIKTKGQIKC